jgi:hypothetical protein
MALEGLRPYCATFFVFLDYLKPSLRLSALGDLGVIYILTHDSIGLGEDGPTHQPIEQLASARAVPGITVLRPADANEVAEGWRVVMERPHRPAVFVLSRQNLPTLDRTNYGSAAGTSRGAYVLEDAPGGKPDCILIGTGTFADKQPVRLFVADTEYGFVPRLVQAAGRTAGDAGFQRRPVHRGDLADRSCRCFNCWHGDRRRHKRRGRGLCGNADISHVQRIHHHRIRHGRAQPPDGADPHLAQHFLAPLIVAHASFFSIVTASSRPS